MRFLVLSGGANRGSYQHGVLKHLIGDLGISYQGYSGISIGAINSAMLSMYKSDQDALKFMNEQWDKTTKDSVIKSWCLFGKVASLWKTSVFDSSPLENWISKDINLEKIRASGKQVSVGAVSLTTSQYKTFNQDNDNFVKGVIASASFPGMFCPVQIDNELYSDGGLQYQVDISSAIKMGATEIDAILCAPEKDLRPVTKFSNTIDVLGRTLSVMSNNILENNLRMCQMYNKLVELGVETDKKYIKLNIIRPNSSLIDDSFDFSQESLKKMEEIGYNQAKSMVIV
jgi:NTE family protein